MRHRLFCFSAALPERRALGELLAVNSVYSSVGSFFSSVGDSFSSVASSVSGSFSGVASSVSGCVGSVASSFSAFFDNRSCVSSHGVNGFAGLVSGFAASSEAQSRSCNSSGKNDLTHNINSLLSECMSRDLSQDRAKAELLTPDSALSNSGQNMALQAEYGLFASFSPFFRLN